MVKYQKELKVKTRKEKLEASLTREISCKLENTQNKQMSILNFKPTSWGKRTRNLSEKIDSILYR